MATNDVSSDLDSLRDAPDIHEALRIARETILANHQLIERVQDNAAYNISVIWEYIEQRKVAEPQYTTLINQWTEDLRGIITEEKVRHYQSLTVKTQDRMETYQARIRLAWVLEASQILPALHYNWSQYLSQNCLHGLAQLSESVDLARGRSLLLAQIQSRTLSKATGFKPTDPHLKLRDIINAKTAADAGASRNVPSADEQANALLLRQTTRTDPNSSPSPAKPRKRKAAKDMSWRPRPSKGSKQLSSPKHRARAKNIDDNRSQPAWNDEEFSPLSLPHASSGSELSGVDLLDAMPLLLPSASHTSAITSASRSASPSTPTPTPSSSTPSAPPMDISIETVVSVNPDQQGHEIQSTVEYAIDCLRLGRQINTTGIQMVLDVISSPEFTTVDPAYVDCMAPKIKPALRRTSGSKFLVPLHHTQTRPAHWTLAIVESGIALFYNSFRSSLYENQARQALEVFTNRVIPNHVDARVWRVILQAILDKTFSTDPASVQLSSRLGDASLPNIAAPVDEVVEREVGKRQRWHEELRQRVRSLSQQMTLNQTAIESIAEVSATLTVIKAQRDEHTNIVQQRQDAIDAECNRFTQLLASIPSFGFISHRGPIETSIAKLHADAMSTRVEIDKAHQDCVSRHRAIARAISAAKLIHDYYSERLYATQQKRDAVLTEINEVHRHEETARVERARWMEELKDD
ncbi:MAG: hypothetical protein L6R38_006510 [Xanthoria sp. 2 TBL-2021]|nr:MAG: hypothetical protein L6R38_006510 [Xanthoria sp. 2 TBL-2021]